MGIVGLLKFVAALGFVLALMGGLALLLKRMGYGHAGLAQGSNRRLKLVEILPLDARRKAVILQCDGEQHLVILGPAGETVVQNTIKQVIPHEASHKDAA